MPSDSRYLYWMSSTRRSPHHVATHSLDPHPHPTPIPIPTRNHHYVSSMSIHVSSPPDTVPLSSLPTHSTPSSHSWNGLAKPSRLFLHRMSSSSHRYPASSQLQPTLQHHQCTCRWVDMVSMSNKETITCVWTDPCGKRGTTVRSLRTLYVARSRSYVEYYSIIFSI